MKMKKIIGSAAAATLALSSVSSYVAFATPVTPATQADGVTISGAEKGTRPDMGTEANAKADAIGTYTATVSGNTITVTFAKTKAEVTAAATAAGFDPVYLTITTSGTFTKDNFVFDGGYDFDVPANKEFNVAAGKIMLWLPATLASDTMSFGFKVDGGAKQTVTINYEYAAEAAAPVTISGAEKGTRPDMGAEANAKADAIGTYTATVSGSTINVTFAKPKSEVTAAATAAGFDPVYLTITTNGTFTKDNFVFDGGYNFDVPEHKEFNVAAGKIMLWLPATFTGNTKSIGFKVDGGATQTITINYAYAAEPVTSEPTTSDTTSSGSSGGTTAVTPVDPVPSTNSGSTTSDATSSAAATVEEVKGEVTADVKVGETVTVKSDDLGGDVTVATDKEDKALEGTKLELEVTNDKTETTKELNEAVGTDASTEVKAVVEAAVKAVEAGNAVTLDISFTKDGKTVQPGKDVTVTVPVPSVVKGADKLFIYHVTDKGLEDITSKCKYDKDKGTVAITNDKFSPYIISKVEIKADSAATSGDSTTTSNGGSTNTNPNTGVALAMAPIILAGAAVAVVSVKKRK